MSKLCDNNPAQLLKRLLDMGEDEILLYFGEEEPIEEPEYAQEMETEEERINMNESESKSNTTDSNSNNIAVDSLKDIETIEQLDDFIKSDGGCTKCRLAEGRNEIVVGQGDHNARIVFIGEGPGAQEDTTGVPFVGRAGKLLDKIFDAMGLSREKGIYICNIVKCRPPNNRDPLPDEAAACIPYLKKQLEIIQPKVICCLGRVAAQQLLETNAPLGRLRGKTHYFEGIPVLATYHPAYLLRNPAGKKPTWEDMKELLRIAELPIPNHDN